MSQGSRQTSHIVAEIFADVGSAFTRLGELEMLLNPNSEHSPYKVVDTEKEVEMLKMAVKKFAEDIEQISNHIKDRTILQIRNSMKRHAYEEAGLPLRKQVVTGTKLTVSQQKTRTTSHLVSQTSAKSADITLNMLNATEQEVDVEGLSTDKLDYDSPDTS